MKCNVALVSSGCLLLVAHTVTAFTPVNKPSPPLLVPVLSPQQQQQQQQQLSSHASMRPTTALFDSKGIKKKSSVEINNRNDWKTMATDIARNVSHKVLGAVELMGGANVAELASGKAKTPLPLRDDIKDKANQVAPQHNPASINSVASVRMDVDTQDEDLFHGILDDDDDDDDDDTVAAATATEIPVDVPQSTMDRVTIQALNLLQNDKTATILLGPCPLRHANPISIGYTNRNKQLLFEANFEVWGSHGTGVASLVANSRTGDLLSMGLQVNRRFYPIFHAAPDAGDVASRHPSSSSASDDSFIQDDFEGFRDRSDGTTTTTTTTSTRSRSRDHEVDHHKDDVTATAVQVEILQGVIQCPSASRTRVVDAEVVGKAFF